MAPCVTVLIKHELDLKQCIFSININYLVLRYSPSPCAGQTGWSPGRRRDTTPQRSDTSEWRQCCRGWGCGRWPSSSSPWWTTLWLSWLQPAGPSACGPQSGLAPLGADKSRAVRVKSFTWLYQKCSSWFYNGISGWFWFCVISLMLFIFNS